MRYYVEVLADSGRLRRYSAPLFIGPEGLLQVFPETEAETFSSGDAAHEAARKHTGQLSYRIGSVATLHRSRRYQTWREKVRGREGYKEGRTPLVESWELYLRGGWNALRRKYTKSHALQLVKRFIAEGLLDPRSEIAGRLLAVSERDRGVWQIAPILMRAEELGIILAPDGITSVAGSASDPHNGPS